MGRSPSPSQTRRRAVERDRRDRRRKKRSKERSRDREKRGNSGRDRDRSRERVDKARHRSRSHSVERRRSFSRERREPVPGSSRVTRSGASGGGERPHVTEADLEGKSVEEREMMKTMGFCGFETTKNKKVDGNNVGEVHVILKRKYRQYMNRKGGFNRPLDFVA